MSNIKDIFDILLRLNDQAAALRTANFDTYRYCTNVYADVSNSSIDPTIESMTSRRQIQDGGPHDFRSKMAAPTTSDPRWRPTKSDPRWRPHEVRYKMADPVTRSVTPQRVSQRPRPREGSVTS